MKWVRVRVRERERGERKRIIWIFQEWWNEGNVMHSKRSSWQVKIFNISWQHSPLYVICIFTKVLFCACAFSLSQFIQKTFLSKKKCHRHWPPKAVLVKWNDNGTNSVHSVSRWGVGKKRRWKKMEKEKQTILR